ncbi:hypothetical protein ACMYSQ_009831 [Aspergillus niger]
MPNGYHVYVTSRITSHGFEGKQYIPAGNFPSFQHVSHNYHFSHMTHPGYQVHHGSPLQQVLKRSGPSWVTIPPQSSLQGSVQAQAGPSQGNVANNPREPEQPESQSRELSPLESGHDIVCDVLIVGEIEVTDENAQDLLPLEARLFVGNIPSALCPTQIKFELKRILARYGCCYVKVKTNPNSGLRTAFAQFETPEVANRVMQKSKDQPSEFDLHHRSLRFEMAKGKREISTRTRSREVFSQPDPCTTRVDNIEGRVEPAQEMNGEGRVEPAHNMNAEGNVEPTHRINGEGRVEPPQDNREVVSESGKSAGETRESFYNVGARGSHSAPCLPLVWEASATA